MQLVQNPKKDYGTFCRHCTIL